MSRISEINRRANKTSYQGPALQARIKRQFKKVETMKRTEREVKRAWLSAQVRVIIEEDELADLCTIANRKRS